MIDDDSETMETAGLECPHCGYLEHDAWELKLSEGEPEESEAIQCGDCGKPMVAWEYTRTTYYAKAVVPDPELREESK